MNAYRRGGSDQSGELQFEQQAKAFAAHKITR